MARIVNKEGYDQKRNEILDAAMRLIYTHGYDQMSIQEILAEVHFSKGAFYHYFDSKQALLEALIERMAGQVMQILIPIVADPGLPAPDKLHLVFDAASRWKTDRREVMLNLVKVWYADENAILRQKAQAALLPGMSSMITEIIRQGCREGVFQTAYPDQISGIIFALLQSFGDTLITFITRHDQAPVDIQQLEKLSASHQDAVERVLGAEPGSLPLFDTSILREWFPLSTNSKE